MMAATDASIAAVGTSLILETSPPLLLGFVILGSQLPELDTTTSTIELSLVIVDWVGRSQLLMSNIC